MSLCSSRREAAALDVEVEMAAAALVVVVEVVHVLESETRIRETV